MAVWRCPHCATPQPESSRCWVCRRSTTVCLTCRHFRRGVAGGLGMCGLDPRRSALTGSEMRACWVAAPAPTEPGARAPVAVGPGVRPAEAAPARRTFVPVEPLPPSPARTTAGAMPAPAPGTAEALVARAAGIGPATGSGRHVPGTWWLWGDPDPWPDR